MRWLLSGYLATLWRWYVSNKRCDRSVEKTGRPFLVVGYEELALYPALALSRMCELLEIEFDERMLVPGNTHSHVARGNPMRSRDDKLQAIQYDDRWFRDHRLLLPIVLSPHIMNYNRRHVYPNVASTLWDQKKLYGRGVQKPGS